MLTVECVRIPLQWWVYLYQYTPAEEARKEGTKLTTGKFQFYHRIRQKGLLSAWLMRERGRDGGSKKVSFHWTRSVGLETKSNKVTTENSTSDSVFRHNTRWNVILIRISSAKMFGQSLVHPHTWINRRHCIGRQWKQLISWNHGLAVCFGAKED